MNSSSDGQPLGHAGKFCSGQGGDVTAIPVRQRPLPCPASPCHLSPTSLFTSPFGTIPRLSGETTDRHHPTRGATPTWQRVAVRGRGWQNLLPLGVSGGCGAGTSAWCHSMPPPASNPYVAVYVTPKANLRSGGNSQCRRAGGLWAASVTQSGRATLTRAPLLRLSGRKTRTSSGRRLPRAGGCNTHGRFALQPVAG